MVDVKLTGSSWPWAATLIPVALALLGTASGNLSAGSQAAICLRSTDRSSAYEWISTAFPR
ncbi:hypothetical protein ABT294_32230 [Nonomuraea sp. NPDC000554]|uniref:hypothetical protein n=1 Tax=Nonomuraea sp. NPDC000554 TaxID=3154259 RepID=UPI00332C5C05